MKRIILFLLITILFADCKKDSAPNNQIAGVTGFSWEVFGMRRYSEMYLPPYPQNWYLKLNTDYTFSISLHDSISGGTYTWNQVDSINSIVKFNIQYWRYSNADTAFSNRLKAILLSVDSCYYINKANEIHNPANYPLHPSIKGLKFYGQEGWLQVIK